MKRPVFIIATAVVLAAAFGCTHTFDPSSVADATRYEVQRVEPLSWWTDMNTSLQLMVQGPGISEYEVRAEGLTVYKCSGPPLATVPITSSWTCS